MVTAKEGSFSAMGHWWGALTNPAKSERAFDRFKVGLLDQFNYPRITAKLELLCTLHPRIRTIATRMLVAYRSEACAKAIDYHAY